MGNDNAARLALALHIVGQHKTVTHEDVTACISQVRRGALDKIRVEGLNGLQRISTQSDENEARP